VCTPKALFKTLEKSLVDKPWQSVHEGMEVRLLEEENELYVQARSRERRMKENAMRRRRLKKLGEGLHRLKRRIRKDKPRVKRDDLLERLAVLKKEAGPVAALVKINKPATDEPINLTTFSYELDQPAWQAALERDGSYILRAFVPWKEWPAGMEKEASVLWKWYMQLIHVEESFKTLKSDLSLRPIHHQIEKRVEAHILVAFLGYCLTASLRMKLARAAPGLSPRAVLQSLSAIQMMEVHIPTRDGRMLVMPRHTQPEVQQRMILEKLNLELPPQPPPSIRSGKVELTRTTRGENL